MDALRLLIGVTLLFLIITFLRRNRKKGRQIVSDKAMHGFLIWQWVDRITNYGLYPVALYFFGLWWGGLIMIIFTLVENLVYIHINNRTDEDWTFMSWLIRLRDAKAFVWISQYDHLLKRALHLPTRVLRRIVICWCAFVRQLLRARIGRFRFANAVAFFLLSIFQETFH